MHLLFFNITYSNLIYLDYTKQCIMYIGRAVDKPLYIFSGS